MLAGNFCLQFCNALLLFICACPRINGKLDFPCLQTFMLKVLRNSKAPPKSTPLPSVAGLRENRNPIIPPVKTNPPTTKDKDEI